MKAVVMAGGEGTRLRPLTTRRPKPLTPVLNRPVMEYILVSLREAGIKDVVVTVHYMADSIEAAFGDGSDLGVNLIYSVEDTPLGTAGSVKKAEEYLRDDTFIIVSGDALTDARLGDAIAFHRNRQADATLVLAHVPNPLEFGIVVTEPDGRIRRFLEKPSWGEVFSDTVNTGMYVLEPDVLDYMEPGKPYDWSQDIFPRMLADGKALMGHVMLGYWCDIGNLLQYREAQYAVLDGNTGIRIGGTRKGDCWIGEGASVARDATLIGPSLIGRNVTIKSGAEVGPYTVIGDHSIIEEGVTVHRSVVWDNVYVGEGSRLSACTVCSHAVLQGECLIEEGAVIGDRVRLERGASVRTQVKIWPDKLIEAGARVTMSVIWGQKWQGALFGDLGVSGVANVEITPEFATRLGAAYGAFLKPGTTVMTARDSGPAARMVKRAVIAGLLSVGCNVVDLRSASFPIMRHSLRNSVARGGVYVRLAPDNPRILLVEFLDGDGVYLSSAAERKIESIFYREDFRRADVSAIGSLEFSGRSIEQYREDYLRHLEAERIRQMQMRIVVDFSFSRVASVFGGILGNLECDVIALNAFTDPKRVPDAATDRAEILERLATTVRTLGADLGAMIQNDGERLTLVDSTGRVIEGDMLLMLFAVLFARTHASAKLVVPVTAPSCLDRLARLHEATVIRTKTDVRSILASAASTADAKPKVTLAADRAGGFSFPDFHNAFDALFAVGKLLEAVSTTDLKVHEVVDVLPQVHILHERLRCPWQAKGRVMLSVSQRAGTAESVDLTDGVKVSDDDGWTLVVPDSSAPIVHVIVEAQNADAARARLEAAVAEIAPLTELSNDTPGA
ncbi:MAG: NTP transferase domain-containing protein [Chthonomonadales bacterium]|nr:NTP transferase domain-containing protein [Chthonomonadales bacterium]